jgi:hypothetical protein
MGDLLCGMLFLGLIQHLIHDFLSQIVSVINRTIPHSSFIFTASVEHNVFGNLSPSRNTSLCNHTVISAAFVAVPNPCYSEIV